MSGRKSQCCAEMPVHNGVAYCIKPKGHDGMHRTAEITFGDSAVEAADEITRLRAENERLVEAIEELEETVREMLRAIQRGRLASIGAIHNTYVALISVGRVEKWSNALTDQEGGAND